MGCKNATPLSYVSYTDLSTSVDSMMLATCRGGFIMLTGELSSIGIGCLH